MMIKEISIRNLRGIRECEIHDLGQINLLIGKNSTGKSTILESIQLVASVIIYPPGAVSVLVNRRSNRSWHPQELWYKYDPTLELSVSLLFDNKNRVAVTAHRESTPENRESIGFYVSGTGAENPIKFKKVDSGVISSLSEQYGRGYRTTRYEPDRREIGKLSLPNDVLIFLEGATLIEPTGSIETSALEKEFPNIKFSGKYEHTAKALKQIYDEKMQSWELFPYLSSRDSGQNRTALMYEGGRPIYVDNLGDGVKYGFAAITLACNRHDSALLMEEIETHQHPSSLRMLIKFLVEIAKENRLQLFVSTQSPDVLRYFKMSYPETKVFLIERDPVEDIVYAHDEADLMKIFREVGWDFEDLLRYERIAVVDGIEDAIIIENLFEKMRGYPLGSEGIKLLLVRGDPKKFGEIVKAVAISSRKLIVIKDLDEMKTRDDVIALVISWLKSLENEGWDVQVSGQEVIGEHRTSRKKWKIPTSKILKAGNFSDAVSRAEACEGLADGVSGDANALRTDAVAQAAGWWVTVLVSAAGSVVFVCVLFLVWRRFKRVYGDRLLKCRPEVVG